MRIAGRRLDLAWLDCVPLVRFQGFACGEQQHRMLLFCCCCVSGQLYCQQHQAATISTARAQPLP